MITTLHSTNSNAGLATIGSPTPTTATSTQETVGRYKTEESADGPKISNLARQLSESAARASVRDATSSRMQLSRLADDILKEVMGDGRPYSRARNSAVPNSDDPELLARAIQATDHVNLPPGSGVKNPFAGLSREQLSLIVFDQDGDYTLNERRAARMESMDLEGAWRRQLFGVELGPCTPTDERMFYQEVLDHYLALPLIEQAEYPPGYALRLQCIIDQKSNYKPLWESLNLSYSTEVRSPRDFGSFSPNRRDIPVVATS